MDADHRPSGSEPPLHPRMLPTASWTAKPQKGAARGVRKKSRSWEAAFASSILHFRGESRFSPCARRASRPCAQRASRPCNRKPKRLGGHWRWMSVSTHRECLFQTLVIPPTGLPSGPTRGPLISSTNSAAPAPALGSGPRAASRGQNFKGEPEGPRVPLLRFPSAQTCPRIALLNTDAPRADASCGSSPAKASRHSSVARMASTPQIAPPERFGRSCGRGGVSQFIYRHRTQIILASLMHGRRAPRRPLREPRKFEQALATHRR